MLQVGDKLKLQHLEMLVQASGHYYRVQATAQQATEEDPFIHEQEAAEKRATINQPEPVAINVPKPAAQKLAAQKPADKELDAVNRAEAATGQDAVEEPKRERRKKQTTDLEEAVVASAVVKKRKPKSRGQTPPKTRRKQATEETVIAQPAVTEPAAANIPKQAAQKPAVKETAAVNIHKPAQLCVGASSDSMEPTCKKCPAAVVSGNYGFCGGCRTKVTIATDGSDSTQPLRDRCQRS